MPIEMRLTPFVIAAALIAIQPMSGRDLSTTNAPRRVSVGDADKVIAQVVDGGTWRTEFILTNLSSSTAYFQMFFRADDGSSMELPIAGLGSTPGVYGSLAVNETVTFSTEGTAAALKQGYAIFFSLDRVATDPNAQTVSRPIGGMAVFRQRISGRPDFEAVVPVSSLFDTKFTIPFDNRDGFSTGIAIVNPHPSSSSPVQLVIRDSAGTVILQDSLTLPPSNKTTFSMPARYPQSAGKNGVLQVSTTTGALSGLGLRFNPTGPFTSMHALSVEAAAPPPPTPPTGSLPGITTSCTAIEGATIYASDGQFLGKITSNTYDADSIGNQYGKYGSAYSSTSIFNEYGKYGSSYSALSAFNPYAATPPTIYIGTTGMAYLTVNPLKTPGVPPSAIYTCIGRR